MTFLAILKLPYGNQFFKFAKQKIEVYENVKTIWSRNLQ